MTRLALVSGVRGLWESSLKIDAPVLMDRSTCAMFRLLKIVVLVRFARDGIERDIEGDTALDEDGMSVDVLDAEVIDGRYSGRPSVKHRQELRHVHLVRLSQSTEIYPPDKCPKHTSISSFPRVICMRPT